MTALRVIHFQNFHPFLTQNLRGSFSRLLKRWVYLIGVLSPQVKRCVPYFLDWLRTNFTLENGQHEKQLGPIQMAQNSIYSDNSYLSMAKLIHHASDNEAPRFRHHNGVSRLIQESMTMSWHSTVFAWSPLHFDQLVRHSGTSKKL